MSLLRFLGLGSATPRAPDGPGDTASVRRIAAKLERLDPSRARHLAAFAYVLARVAAADLRIDDLESAEMESIVAAGGGLDADAAALVVEIAKSQARLLGGTENYVVTREFRRISSREDRLDLMRCLYAVAAADGTIAAAESSEIAAIGDELGFTRPELNALRAAHRDKLSELRTARSDEPA
jgi:uncharacterized tellurite resistance protein B-like protein